MKPIDPLTPDVALAPTPGLRAPEAGDADFTIEWADPSDAAFTWEHDDMHLPFALTPLAADMITDVLGRSFNPRNERFGGPQRTYAAVWHGYAYFSFRFNVPAGEENAFEARWTETCRARIPVTLDYWQGEALPALREMFDWMAGLPVDELPSGELAAAWETAWERCLEAWIIHFVAIMGPYQALDDLVDAYQAAMGEGREAEALELTAGGHHELEDVEAGIEALTGLAGPVDGPLASAIEATAAVVPVTASIDLDALRAHPGGPAFVDALRDFLVEHGHLGQNHDDLRLASWAEAPRLLLGRIAARFRAAPEPQRERESRLRRRADELAEAVGAALAEKPDELARFETVLAAARSIGWLTEGHNYWIDRLSQARLRALSLRIGARLVREGLLDAPDDVFFLHRAEVAEAVRTGESRRALVAERRAEHARNERRKPPSHVGAAPAAPSEGDRFDGARVASTEADLLKGTGASAGIVRGPARLALNQDDFGRIQPGDIVVCPSSNPSWVPIFTIAGGLVTNTGGVLSHAAVVAREFGLPAVVGTTDATSRIADGRLVEIDGTAGTVRLL